MTEIRRRGVPSNKKNKFYKKKKTNVKLKWN